MAIPSTQDVRGRQDTSGYAATAEQMAKLWELSDAPPLPDELLGPAPAAGVAGAICPHDAYLYAGRIYRRVLRLVTAKTVILVGPFHKYRRFGVHDALIFDPYRAWQTPEGELPVSALRDELVAKLPPQDVIRDAAMHDQEHSLEAISLWLKHLRPDVEIVPIIIPGAPLPRLQQLAQHFGQALAAAMKRRHLLLGRDVAVVISADATHYGADFQYVPYGAGGVDAYLKATEADRALLKGALAGPVTPENVAAFFATVVDPDKPDDYRRPWCGRFSIPFGMLLLRETGAALGLNAPVVGHPIAYGASVGIPELPLRDAGLGGEAPANLFHFVGYPATAFTTAAR